MPTLDQRLYAISIEVLQEDPAKLTDGDLGNIYRVNPELGKRAREERDRKIKVDRFKAKLQAEQDAADLKERCRIARRDQNNLSRYTHSSD
jgi:hypothetical protein